MAGFIRVICLLALVYISVRCENDKSQNRYFESFKDGEKLDYLFSHAKINAVNDSVYFVSVCGARSDYRQSITLSFYTDKPDIGTFAINSYSFATLGLQAVFNDDSVAYSTAYNPDIVNSGILTIKELNNDFIRGSFSFIATSIENPDLIITIDNGIFCAEILK